MTGIRDESDVEALLEGGVGGCCLFPQEGEEEGRGDGDEEACLGSD